MAMIAIDRLETDVRPAAREDPKIGSGLLWNRVNRLSHTPTWF
jgi:hypothetical protein